jgi:hypothetical protein
MFLVIFLKTSYGNDIVNSMNYHCQYDTVLIVDHNCKQKFNPCDPEIDWDYNGWMEKKSKWAWIIVICRIKLAEMWATWFIVVQGLKKASTRKTQQKSSEPGMAIVLCMKEHCIMIIIFIPMNTQAGLFYNSWGIKTYHNYAAIDNGSFTSNCIFYWTKDVLCKGIKSTIRTKYTWKLSGIWCWNNIENITTSKIFPFKPQVFVEWTCPLFPFS